MIFSVSALRELRVLTFFALTACGAATPAQHSATPHIEADSGRAAAPIAEPAAPPVEPEATPPPAAEPAPEPAPEPVEWSVHDPDAPITLPPEVYATVRAAVRAHPRRNEDVFAKIGDSATASRLFMRCFAEDDELELAGRDELRPVIERIRAARVAGRTSFSRESEAAIVGRSVHQLMRGSPSPVTAEIRALSPRYALVMFGGNDIEIGRLDLYSTSMLALVDQLLANGTIPILSTIPARLDDAESNREVPRYQAVIRAVARARRVPLVDLHRAIDDLPNRGLASDGVHPNAPVVDGRAHACDFGETGMQHGMNVRNLLNLRVIAHLQEYLSSDAEAPEVPQPPPATRVDGDRFVTVATTRGGTTALDGYEGCEATQDESGPERRYALRVDAASHVRAQVMYDGPVDVDVHLLRDGRCVARGDSILHADLEPGDYEVVVDTFEGAAHAGEYMLLVERSAREE